jgi:hypothetical protein
VNARKLATLNEVEARAREIAGGIHARGAIPARCWRQAIAERFLNEQIRDPEWAERMIGLRDAGAERVTTERLAAWVDDLQLSARVGFPHYRNPGELKEDIRAVLAEVEQLREEKAVSAGSAPNSKDRIA